MLSILRKARLKDKEMRVLLLGLDGAGKSSICAALLKEPLDKISPTLGFAIKTIEHDGYKLNIWDVGGQKTLRTYWRNYFERTDTLIWVVDATDRIRLGDCAEELGKLLLEERLSGASLLIFNNKSDVQASMSDEEVRKGLHLDDIRTHTWTIISSSAVTGLGLHQGIEWVLQDAKNRLFLF
ncbi:ADP-ribosylation factor [Microthyrium microscopicum]|uniref:Abnormal eversion of vulva protein 20 n=1 Tax=Microthyrium microscopicum TaxID=703497 RepID=A0A6A6UGG3_9PEZI|nr:ADP-ribosylation factor [Microthyrium microscopicum]